MDFFILCVSILTVINALFYQQSTAQVLASLYFPHGPVREHDEQATLECEVEHPPSRYEIVFSRELKTGAQDIIFINSRVRSHLRHKYSVSLEDPHTYILTIWDVSLEDTGKYACRVGVPTGDSSTSFVATGSGSLEVFYLPDTSVSPHCSILNHDLNGPPPNLGDIFQLQCLSQAGKPIVDMDWIQNEKGLIPNSRGSRPSTSNGVVVSVAEVTMLPEHLTAVFSCTITSTGFPTFSKTCTVGPFVSASITEPPAETNGTSAKTPFVKQQESVGRNDEGMMSEMKIPIFAGIPAALLCLLFIVIIVIVVKRRRTPQEEAKNMTKETEDNQKNFIISSVKCHDVDNEDTKKVMTPVQHVVSPNGGQLYAVVQKNSPEDANVTCSETDNAGKSKTLPLISIVPKQAKLYPPPPAYPTEREQHEINKIIDKKSGFKKAASQRHNYQNTTLGGSPLAASPGLQRRRTIGADVAAHEYATLDEVAAQSGQSSGQSLPMTPRTQRSHSTVPYTTVNLY